MCLICKDYLLGNLTALEVERNMREALVSEQIDFKHADEILQLIEPEDDSA